MSHGSKSSGWLKRQRQSLPLWVDDELWEATKKLWERKKGRELSDQEILEIILNSANFIGTLKEILSRRGD